ncbi:hypothetical protein KNV00_gp130 [Streptomyces phage Bmoc]|uniref:KOW domain-containing protein n=1 Tax=Streptomyces phage Bmoc TaxID=2725629 RepID=A0A6M3SZ07_9CAUD|nr:hypothetical protein KNV00_gp130 [Streptomyces phage Bmoc]QJD50889.1 hypothetical protein SEA_BMOC_165 [Streptomyces phage Bmoc]
MAFKVHDKVKVVSGPHAGKTGKVLAVTGKTCTVKTKEGTYHIHENDLRGN